MNNQKGVVHLVLLFLVLLILIGGVVYGLIFFKIIKNPLQSLPVIGKQDPTIAVKSEYKNPFDKKSQYVNPFDQYKSALLNLKR